MGYYLIRIDCLISNYNITFLWGKKIKKIFFADSRLRLGGGSPPTPRLRGLRVREGWGQHQRLYIRRAGAAIRGGF
jgi:hypothetical protein